MSRLSPWANFWQMLIAILIGNLLYALVSPHLPEAARHHLFRLDWGVVVDFWFCLVAYGAISTFRSWRRKRQE
jgi:hypothetical protein